MKTFFHPRRIVVKVFLLTTIAYTILVTLNSILAKPDLHQYRKLLYQQFTHKYNQLYYNFLASNYDLNNNDDFNRHLAVIRKDAVEEDRGNNELWMLNEEITEHLPLTMPIPSAYYSNYKKTRENSDKSSREESGTVTSAPLSPFVPKFDPRLTLGAYYQYIARTATHTGPSNSENLALPFHWSDWVDLSILEKYVIAENNENDNNNNDDQQTDLCAALFDISNRTELIEGSELRMVEEYCQSISDDDSMSSSLVHPQLGFKITDQPGPQTIPNREVISRAYLFATAPSPKKLIFLTTNGSYQVDVSNPHENNFNNSLLHNGIIDSLPIDTLNVVEDYKYLQTHKPQSHQQPQQQQQQAKDTKEVDGTSSSSSPPHFFSSYSSSSSFFSFSSVPSRHELHIPKSAFRNDPESVIDSMKRKQQQTQLSLMEKDYLDSISFSHHCQDPPKYFYEAKLLKSTPDDWQGEHYDWRFFQGITLDLPENSIILHRLIKNYLNFARIHGITTWIAHGSLLAWYWNGVAFPWDGDVDVQVPVSELYKLGQYYNQTLVVENAADSSGKFDGMGRYFVDIGSSITHRTRGNGNNAIDGRFIDVDTGLYIDITGLALTDAPSPDRYELIVPLLDKEKQAILATANGRSEGGKVVKDFSVINRELELFNCRNNHFTSYQELSPLITSISENQLAYIPKNFMMILQDEYNLNALSRKQHRSFTFLNNLRLWFNTKSIKKYAHMENVDAEGYDFKSLQILNSLTPQDHLNLLGQENTLLQEWELTKNFTKLHHDELKMIYEGKIDQAGELIERNLVRAESGGLVGKALRADYFMHKLMTSGEIH
ncbi:hypothetical protein KGF57_003294 [Candida theae]|uniref:LicD/FKTN/FKRP nucleotidyltransferase domain-containing protein n=1 Tax=Candida theae TaxID=1198502 RepID=A0AAD5BDI7_9ASCO|nr:uncharacterized protein KGF57_003294 [Candida theae]KAI5957600.1 hypothetical protein KGF57_003294 [Candida theae]